MHLIIKSNHCKAGISIKPNTDVSEILDLLEIVHVVLVMTVEPGKGGQKLVESTLDKVRFLREYIKNNDLDCIIEADGGIKLNNVESVKNAGAEIIVSGTEIINSENYSETIKKMSE